MQNMNKKGNIKEKQANCAQWNSSQVEVHNVQLVVEAHNVQLASNVSFTRGHLDNEDKDRFNCENIT